MNEPPTSSPEAPNTENTNQIASGVVTAVSTATPAAITASNSGAPLAQARAAFKSNAFASVPTSIASLKASNSSLNAPAPAPIPAPVVMAPVTGAVPSVTAPGPTVAPIASTTAPNTAVSSTTVPSITPVTASAPVPSGVSTTTGPGMNGTRGIGAAITTAAPTSASTQLPSIGAAVIGAAVTVPICTIRWPKNSSKTPSDTESICDTIGLRKSSAVDALLRKLDLFWENGSVIPYSFIGGTAGQQTKFNLNINNWANIMNYRFMQVASAGFVRVSFDPNAGSWSYIGQAAREAPPSEATVNIVLSDTYTLTASEASLALHLLCHMLGMMHEHPGPGNGGSATLDEQAVYSCYQQCFGWDSQTTKTQILDVYNSKGVSNYDTVRPSSLMRYPIPAVLTTQQMNVLLPEGSGVPGVDLSYLMANYPMSNVAPTQLVDDATAQAMADAQSQGNIRKMRAIFHAYLLSGRLAPPGSPDQPAHGVDPTHPRPEDLGWCATIDPVDSSDIASGTNAPSGVQHGAIRAIPSFISSLFGNTGELWDPYTVITYGFLNPDKATEYRRTRVRNALAWYSRNTSLSFQFVDNIHTWDFGQPKRPNLDALNRCNIRIFFGTKDEWKSKSASEPEAVKPRVDLTTVGWAAFGRAQVTATKPADAPNYLPEFTSFYISNQAMDKDNDLEVEDLLKSDQTLYHELGHALGLHHEHAIPNTPIDITKDEFEKDLVGTAFDKHSVMLYSGKLYKASSEQTSVNSYPSPTDLAMLRLIYPDKPEPTGYTFNSALEEMDFNQLESAIFRDLRNKVFKDGNQISPSDLRKLRTELIDNLKKRPRLARGVTARPAHPTIHIDTRAELIVKPGFNGRDAFGPVTADPTPFAYYQYNDSDPPESVDPNAGGPSGPAHGAQNNPPLTSGPAPPVQAPGFLHELVTNLKQFFSPGGNQIFTLQFPGRFLDQASYAWDTSSAGVYGQFIKPTAVNEAEFRLVDQLYDVAPNVGGPNGTNLSIVYEQLLNNLLPKYVDNGLAQQQDQIRQWMIKDVPMTQWVGDIMQRQQTREQSLAQAIADSTSSAGTAAPTADPSDATKPPAGMMFGIANKSTKNGETLNRIELSELLMNEYLYAKQDWEVERDRLIRQASQGDIGTPESQRALNDLTRQLAHITDTRQAQLASKYSDAVVRGYSHTIRQYMGYLDIASPAEALQDAKDSLREAAMSSLDGSMKVYPVQLTPLDWFAGLSTSFTLEDLTLNPEIIRTQIQAKSYELDTLTSQLVSLQMGSRGDPTDLQNKVRAAQTALDSAQSALSQSYSNNVIAMAKTCLDAYGKLDTKTLSSKVQIAEAVLADLPAMMDTVQTAQDKLTSSSRALSQLLAAQALAEATDTKQQQQQITLQIQSLSADLKELETRWQALTASTGGVNPKVTIADSSETVPTGPIELPAESSSGGSRWQTITFTSNTKSREASTNSDSSASSQQWSCNLWFASGSGSSSSSTATSSSTAKATDDTIDLALRVTMVTVDRGGWFQPQFFKESKTFYKVDPDVTWTSATPDAMPNILKGETPVTGLMPGFPIAFLIAKDIVIRITHSSSSSAESKQADAASAASSGGLLCFSYSNSHSSSSTSTSSNFQSYSNGFIVKIPGPQILGYMIQLADPDQTKLMPATLPTNFFIPDDEYNKGVEGGGGPDHTINPGGSKADAPTITQDKLREMLDKMLNDKIGELFNEAKGPSEGTSA
ncbi:ZnMc domain-containing protein [Favolaschia claudopus]|uniref:ZnMc domain-containing protein n=1 Tax=Favolaschia claudopus TaxID=2862362 RepID=A0AAV9ZET7_9AGAR